MAPDTGDDRQLGKTLAMVAAAGMLFYSGYAVSDIQHDTRTLTMDNEATVTCYKWVDNGTAKVSCPSAVGIEDGVVRIDVEPCRNFTVAIDEEPACEVGT